MRHGKWIIIVLATMFAGIMVGGYMLINAVFPPAEPIDRYIAEPIVSIKIMSEGNEEIEPNGVDTAMLKQYLSEAKPTRTMSVNDYPPVKLYYEMNIKSGERTICCFVYEENNTTYVELPYLGVYTVDSQIMELLEKQ